MDAGRLKKYRRRLEDQAKRLGGTVAALEDQVMVPTGGQSDGGLSNAPLHMADIGTDVYAQELGTTLLENETYLRTEVFEALDRLDAGTFGECEHCGEKIPAPRLEAIPYARYCVKCATKHGGHSVNFNDGRPNGRPSGER